jgi:hypothetical protein
MYLFYAFYPPDGSSRVGHAFETAAAVEAGNSVRREVRRYQARASGLLR